MAPSSGTERCIRPVSLVRGADDERHVDLWAAGHGQLVIVIDQIDNIRAPGGIVWLDVTMREKSNFDVKEFTTLPET